jgi:hypothetical protein
MGTKGMEELRWGHAYLYLSVQRFVMYERRANRHGRKQKQGNKYKARFFHAMTSSKYAIVDIEATFATGENP